MAPDVFRIDDAVAAVVGTAPAEVLFEGADACSPVAIMPVDERSGESVHA